MGKQRRAELERAEIREIFRRHQNTITDLAGELGLRTQTISGWLSGRPSKRVAEAAQTRALALLAQERGRQGAA